ncbi:virulence factor [Novosphingobium sp. KCTC 2891]|uniref:virulence factor n=1 Tax=Novosphingobium sp. KCTC 2891 TaxID=2989730 RepID=UPI0022239287|nr:virulence factor [Novosphingobium sp. KCTC 2891]MCW1383578.1 virulence factor [Novosphingobium sp. KCTC 2891]
MAVRPSHRKLFALIAALPILAFATMAVGGYFDRDAVRYLDPTTPRTTDLVAVYLSGDMGLDVGAGEGAVAALRGRGIPVLAVNSSALFGIGRDRAYVDALVADAAAQAVARSGASRVALIGNSFGADVLGTGIGTLPADLRARIASVVLVVPGTTVFFHANPSGLFYQGRPDSDPRRTARLLRGLPVTCIYGSREDESLCRAPELARARRVAIDDGHLMLRHYDALASAIADAALAPPGPML